MSKNSVMYKIVFNTSAVDYEEYNVYSHEFTNGLLILNLGILECGARVEIGIPISRILGYYTTDIGE